MSSSPSPSPSSSSSGGPAAGEMTLTGVVEAGVEAGCLILKAEGKAYLLVGGPTEVVKAGAHVVVRGRPDPGMISYCQQGEPFRVSEAHPA